MLLCSVCKSNLGEATLDKKGDTYITPCEYCLERKHNEGIETGNSEGYDHGYADGEGNI